MSIKMVDDKVRKYVPICERELPEQEQTAVCFKPMSKRDNDEYIASLTEFRRNKIVSKTDVSSEILFKKVLAPDDKGIIIYNANINGTVSDVKERDLAVKYLMGLPADIGTEIEQELRGFSNLDEDETKN